MELVFGSSFDPRSLAFNHTSVWVALFSGNFVNRFIPVFLLVLWTSGSSFEKRLYTLHSQKTIGIETKIEAIMRVILKKDVPNLGRAGELKDVKNGYARQLPDSTGLCDAC